MRLAIVVSMVWATLVSGSAAQQAESQEIYPMVFPVAGDVTYRDSWGAPRSEGRTHEGADIFAPKGTPVVAAAPGIVVRITVGERAGRYIVVEHFDGWRTYYLHLDNDTPGTDDGLAGAPAAGIVVGARVEAGQILDYVGDSGNAEETPPHLHFELHPPGGEPINPYPHLRAAQTAEVVFDGSAPTITPRGPDMVNTDLVGSFDPGGGFTAGVAAHAGTAYLGTWGRPETCPGTGVRIIDVTDPAEPTLLGAIATGDDYPGTSTDNLWVGAVDNEWFTGDLAVIGVRRCDNTESGRFEQGFRGLVFYDVTDPAAPKRIGRVAAGSKTQGVHEVDVAAHSDGTVLVAATVVQSVLHTDGAMGDVRLIDATNPRRPVQVADWDLRRDGPSEAVEAMLAARDEEEFHAHSATFGADGAELWVAHWDAGVVRLDIAEPSAPTVLTMTGFEPNTEGNAHAIAIDDERSLVVRTNEDLFPTESVRHVAGWGGQSVYAINADDELEQLSEFATGTTELADADPPLRRDGYYSAHEAVIVDKTEYVAWYSSGVRIVDLTDPMMPQEIGFFIPPPRVDPTGHWKAPDGTRAFPMVWGVTVVEDLIFISDIHSGLWIARFDDGLSDEMTLPPDFEPVPGGPGWPPVK
jgi:hypothetical protein